MSYMTQFNMGGVIGAGIDTITGDAGVPIVPVGGNVDILGGNVLTTTGVGDTLTIDLDNGADGQVLIGGGADPAWATITSTGGTILFTPGANTLNMETAAAVPTSFATDAGSAVPAAGILTVSGGTGISTSGAGSTVTVTLDTPVVVANGGTGATTLTDHGVLVGSGVGAVTPLAVGTNGQVLLGSTGADPVFATLTSTGGTVDFTLGAGTLNLETDGAVSNSFPTDSGTATPAAGVLTVAGGTGISTSGAGSTVTITLDTPVIVADGGTGRTSHTAYAVICGGTGATTAQQSIASVGTSSQVLTSNGAGALPTFQDAAGGGLTWNEETGTSATMAVDNGYIANNAALVTLTLPTTAALGSIIRVTGKGAGGWKIAQNASEVIHFGTSDTTTGVGGSLASTETYDSVELVCTVADTAWTVLSVIGNITVV